jgi:hypothetical protein
MWPYEAYIDWYTTGTHHHQLRIVTDDRGGGYT